MEKTKMVINTEKHGDEIQYTITGNAGKHSFFRYGNYKTEEAAIEQAEIFKYWAKVQILE